MNVELFKAILAMDSYNRGYGAGTGNSINGLGGVGSQIGNATIIDDKGDAEAQAAGFYAVAYTIAGGETVISYRGTNADNFGNFITDAWYGYGIGAGAPAAVQGNLAIEFYKAVSAIQTVNQLTGHSLGGGLAGYVGALYGRYVSIFDNMTYENSVRSLYALIKDPLTFASIYDNQGNVVDYDPVKLAFAEEMKNKVYGSVTPYDPAFMGIAKYTTGEVLHGLLPLRKLQTLTPTEVNTYGGVRNPVNLHDMPTFIIARYAELESSNNNLSSDWQNAAPELFDSLFNDDVGIAAGSKTLEGVFGDSQKMRNAIAYSAIDEGTRPFGDAGIRAMFDDATDLGKALGLADASTTLKDAADAVSDILVQFAGQLAIGGVLAGAGDPLLKGVLTLSDDKNTLKADFNSTLWSIGTGNGQPANIAGKDKLIGYLSEKIFVSGLDQNGDPIGGYASVKDIATGMNWLWNDEFGKKIDSVTFPTHEIALTKTIANRTQPSTNVSMFIAAGLNDGITGAKDNDFIYGGKGNDVLRGEAGDDLLAGGQGNDQLTGGAGKDFLAGGEGIDTAFYTPTGAITLNVKAVAPDASRFASTIELNANGDIDRIIGIEKVELSGFADTVIITKDHKVPFPTNVVFDGLAGNDGLIYNGNGVTTSILEVATPTEQLARGTKMEMIANIENIQGTTGNDTLNIELLTSTKVERIDTGAGNDTVWVFGSAIGSKPEIDLGAGDDVINNAPRGSIVYGGTGNDSFNIGKDYLIADAETDDVITNGTMILHGGVTWRGQENPWAKGLGGIKYARNDVGELVIMDRLGNQTFVSNFNFELAGPRTAGILIGEMSLDAYRLFHTPNGAKIYESYEAIFAYYLKAMTGKSFFTAIDPLVLDLDGDGVELSPRGSISPYYDIDADGFAENTGWVRPDDGFLVRDNNNNGKIDNVSEMFGNATTTGFAALKTLDSNNDNKISSLDTNFGVLKIWRDLNGNGVTEAGELQTLTQAGIASINLTSTATNQNIAGNIVAATSSFTRTNGTTSTIADVNLRSNQRDTVWLGDKTVDAASAALPQLKGFGTLNDLRIAMTDSAALKAAVQTALPQLSALNLATMRSAITPVLNAWRAAVPVPAGNPGTTARVDVPILTQTTITGTQVNDFAYQVTDAQGSYWKLASGAAVKNSSGVDIARPTFANVLAQTSTQGSWTSFSGAQIQFLERYLGTELPIGVNNLGGAGSIAAAQGLLNQMWGTLNDVAVRLAVQGPLSTYFVGIKYNPDTNNFEATTGRQIAPTIEAILSAAPTTASGAVAYLATWKPILDVFLQSFDRSDAHLEVSYAFVFQNIVAAYENVGSAASLTQISDAFGLPVDLIRTGAGTVVGGNDADLFCLGAGNQTVQGGLGPDTYVVGKNFGHDVIDDVEAPLSGSPDSLRFAHLNSNQVSMVRDGLDLVITQIGTANDIRIIGQFAGQRSGFGFSGLDPDHGVQEIIFASGEVWDKIDIAKAVSRHTDGNDVINGTDTIDFLDGGKGNDTLNGGGEGDIYSFGKGDGQDIVYDNIVYVGVDTPDILQFKAGLTLDMVTFTRQGTSNDLVIKINGTSEQVTVKDQFYALYTGVLGTQWVSRIEGFAFDDGTTVSWDRVMDMVINSAETAGNDTIYGFSRTDVFNGSAGDDYYSGGEDGDLYTMGLGFGHDTIEDGRTNLYSGNNDTLQFLAGVDPTKVVWSRGADYEHRDDLTLTLEDGSSVTIKQQFFLLSVFDMDINRIEFVDFADGTQWTYQYIKQHLLDITSTAGNDTINGYLFSDDTINGGDGDDYIDGLSGTDTIIGGKGNDILANDGQLNDTGNTTYIHNLGDGIDTIREGGFAGTDTLKLTGASLTSTGVTVTRSADLMSATLSFAGVTDKIILDNQFGPYGAGVENITFSNGVTWTKDDLQKKYLTSVSTAGNDTIYGFGSNINHGVNDIITSGKGDDFMAGLMGDDTYIHNQGDGIDTIDDGGWGGNDTLKLTGAALTSTNVVLTRSASDLNSITLGFAGVTDKIILKNEFSSPSPILNIIFSNGVTWRVADLQANYLAKAYTTGNDTIYGFGTFQLGVDDVITGGKGDDYMNGFYGNDTYIHNQGDGVDTIDEGGGFGNDTLKLTGSALTSTNFMLTATGTNLVDAALTFAGVTDKINITNQLHPSLGYGVENFIFSDGVTLNRSDLMFGSAVNDTITGNNNNNFLFGFNGNDTISGGDGNDTLNGGAGADKLDGGTGTDTASYMDSNAAVNVNLGITTAQSGGYAAGDTLVSIENIIGSAYNDTLKGNSGNNIITGGVGADKIDGSTGTDTVSYVTSAAGVNVNLGVTTAQAGGDAAGDTLISIENIIGTPLNDTFISSSVANKIDGGLGIDSVSYASSTAAVVVNLGVTTAQSGGYAAGDTLVGIENIIGSSYNDTLLGNAIANILNGGAGADKMDGAAGVDTVSYAGSNAAVNVNLAVTTAQVGGHAAGDTLVRIENIIGSSYNDTLKGSSIANIITGGSGNDTMSGGSGTDVFKYSAITDSGKVSGARDIITDFVRGTDKIDLADFAGSFAFKGTGALGGSVPGVNYAQVSGNTIIGIDADGNGTLDMQIQLTGLHTMTASDFLL